MHTHGVVFEVSEGRPEMDIVSLNTLINTGDETGPPSSFDHPCYWNDQSSQPNEEELENLVEDRRI
jgi:hypothetical protein